MGGDAGADLRCHAGVIQLDTSTVSRWRLQLLEFSDAGPQSDPSLPLKGPIYIGFAEDREPFAPAPHRTTPHDALKALFACDSRRDGCPLLMPSESHPEPPVVSVVTVNYKVAELVDELIASVPQAAQDLSFEIIVVDNASADGSVERLRQRHPEVRVIASDVNLGFGRGNNLGVDHARGAFLALVNPDVVLRPGSLSALVAFLRERPKVGLVGPRIELPDGTTQSLPLKLPDGWDAVMSCVPGGGRVARLLAKPPSHEQPQRCGVVHGSCWVFRREAYLAAGGMPTNIFMYGEEIIMGHRLKQAGYEVWYNPVVHVLHQDDACADKRWVPHEKALRKRNGWISANAEIWPRSWGVTWNAFMAARHLSKAATALLAVDQASSKRHLAFVRLHLSGMRRVKGDASNSLAD